MKYIIPHFRKCFKYGYTCPVLDQIKMRSTLLGGVMYNLYIQVIHKKMNFQLDQLFMQIPESLHVYNLLTAYVSVKNVCCRKRFVP